MCIADIPPVKKTVPAKTLQLVRTVALMAIAGGWFFAFYRHDILSAVGQMLIVVAGALTSPVSGIDAVKLAAVFCAAGVSVLLFGTTD